MVLEYIRKGLEIGMNAAGIDKKKAELFVDELVKAGKLTVEEGKMLLQDIGAAASKSEQNLRKIVVAEIDTHLGKMGYISKKEADSLKRKIRELENQLKHKPKKTKHKKK